MTTLNLEQVFLQTLSPPSLHVAILTPCWNHFFNLLFIVFVIIIIYNSLLQRTLPLCLTVKCLYSAHREIIWPCSPVNIYNRKKRLTQPFRRLDIPLEMFCKTEEPFTLLPHCPSLSILPFDFSSSLLLSLWLYKRTWYPDPDKMVSYSETLVCYLLGQPVFRIKPYSSPQHFISWIHWPVVQRAEWAWTQ